MCFILDVNSFPVMFKATCVGHEEFVPLLRWLYDNPRTSLVFGGTKYRRELGRLPKYLDKLAELKRSKKLSEIKDEVVDEAEEMLKRAIVHRDFDDHHIVAIFRSSGCRIFASKDGRSYKFIRNKKLYPKRHTRPNIYTGQRHKGLLCKRNIVRLQNVL